MVEETPGTTRFEPLSALWHIFAAPQSMLILMGLIAVALALGALIPQIPPQAAHDPEAWLAVQTGLFRQMNGLIRALGLFDLYHAFWFRLLLALTGLTLFVRMIESGDLAWQVMGRRAWTVTAFTFWGRHPPLLHVASSLSREEVESKLSQLFNRPGYWWAEVTAQLVPHRVAGRRRVAFWARPLGYAALLMALLGLVLEGIWGWQGEQWQPLPGESRAVGHGNPYTVRLDAFTIQFGDDQQVQDSHSEVTWLDGEAELWQDVVSLGRPTTGVGVAVRQVGFAPVVRMRGWDGNDHPLTLETGMDVLSVTGEAEIRFSSPEAQPLVLIADHDLFLALTFEPNCANGRPALYVDRLGNNGTERQRVGTLQESGSVLVDGLRLEVDLAYVPLLRADYHPAAGLVVAGLALVVVALLASWMASPWLVWIMVSEGEEELIVVEVVGLPGAATNRWLLLLTKRLREVLVDDA